MPAKDIFHDAVKNALKKDGWTITESFNKINLN
ncbi:element excision factor XisH family protein [Candidatus Parabeggiatoa sp. HSG14]|nr:element excision factor XisH family protein [Thiotrichales bacterium HSG14]